MEEEEQDTIEVDKSIFEGDYSTRKSLRWYCSCQSIAEKNSAKIWEVNGRSFIVRGHGINNTFNVFEVVPLIPDMPNVTYSERNLIVNWTEGRLDNIEDELIDKAIKVENYFGISILRGNSVGQIIKSTNRMYVCNGKKITVVAKKHGNQIQESFAWANPEQEVLSI
jgi:hypothetical protein